MPPLQLTDAEQLKALIVDPVITALRLEMRQQISPMVADVKLLHEKLSDHERRLQELSTRVAAVERFKTRIAAICSAIAVVTGIVWRTLLDWIRLHLPMKLP